LSKRASCGCVVTRSILKFKSDKRKWCWRHAPRWRTLDQGPVEPLNSLRGCPDESLAQCRGAI
jgi:hypothetical protein